MQSHLALFHMWRYVVQHYGDTYDWFFFAPDSTYIVADRLVRLVEHISVTSFLMIGRPVDLDENEHVRSCDLNAGIILSQVLKVAVI